MKQKSSSLCQWVSHFELRMPITFKMKNFLNALWNRDYDVPPHFRHESFHNFISKFIRSLTAQRDVHSKLQFKITRKQYHIYCPDRAALCFHLVQGYRILFPLQVICQTIRLPASSTQPNNEESRWAKARSVTAPVKPFSRERSAKPKLRTRIIAWLLAPWKRLIIG